MQNNWVWLKRIKRDSTETTPSSQIIKYRTFKHTGNLEQLSLQQFSIELSHDKHT